MKRLLILHTNDLHSHFEMMPKINAYFEWVRKQWPSDQVLTLDIGDHMDRMSPETEGTNAIANLEIMNATGYDAMVLGNNEGLTFTPEFLGEVVKEHAHFPILGSNIYDKATNQTPDWLLPSLIIEKSGLKIGMLGVTAVYPAYYELLGWQVTDPIEAVKAHMELMLPHTDLIVVLSHLGLRMDQRMAEELEGIDVILGGHTHHVLEEPLLISGTYLAAAGKFGQYAGHIELAYDPAQRRIAEFQSSVVPMTADSEDDSRVAALLEHFRIAGASALDEEVAQLREPLRLDWYGESPLGNLLAAGIRRWTSADIGLVNSGQLLQGLKEGRLTRGRLLEICPGPINPCRVLIRGADLLQALEESLLREFMEKPIRGLGFRGEVLGVLSVDGMTVKVDSSRAPYERVIAVHVGDELLDIGRDYVVGTIDMFTFGSGYLSLSRGRDVVYMLPEFIRDILARELHDHEAIASSHSARFTDISVPGTRN
ncbi:bifunctional metallophosphatase/5'-nucleotidase [Paenibacillus aceris]|uniref:2',3'-cyclic-nucleotide 2'-phosphodiesterase (5'-nucleotidase family) n=1 Tax=Paenibacillus aceris TaxID=869555 RepID=A0ABS4HYS4_9BACL|nr:bifunctional UDP-sugar hydrolase/5'-nucleotidase [Paenibacillus aceris]MBP1963705.1 2',3'-cyclic-nucleotide 2'-phosphodiesterase (5'-nucleotidase family) [Paenibacillus aceris]NHW36962.1 bifunctional metallophosphatase/5'-nucleotidase [Paenibacillus aceris]